MGLVIFIVTILFVFWLNATAPTTLNRSSSRRFSPASGFLLQSARWSAAGLFRAVTNPGWLKQYRETLCAMIGLVFFADSKASDDEIAVLREILRTHFHSIDSDYQTKVIRKMIEARFSGKGIEEHARQMRRLLQGDSAMLETTVILLLCVAASENRVSPKERQLLEAVCREFGIAVEELAKLVHEVGARFTDGDDGGAERQQAHREQQSYRRREAERQTEATPSDDYAVLGISRGASVDEIKKAFRTLALKYHPDRIRAQGLPPMMAERSAKKFREIKDAYERLTGR